MGVYLNPGNDKFRRIINSEIYIDKTGLILYTNKVLDTQQQNICVSRPRRFGKSMAANMLAAYYSRECDSKELFKGLKIYEDKNFEKYLNKYDTIFLDMQEFLSQTENMTEMIELIRKSVLWELTAKYDDIRYFDNSNLTRSLQDIYLNTKIPFVIIIDEWDCIFREYKNNIDEQRKYLDFLRDLLKDKSYIHLAYMTGILPIKKYGTHSALNMFSEFSMTNPRQLTSYVGFTEDEVNELSERYNISLSDLKEWYDGYHFGNLDIYCPWDVLNYIQKVMATGTQEPENFWEHTSDNSVIRTFLERTDFDVTEKFETLLNGGTISEAIEENLTKVGSTHNLSETLLKIPNHEVMSIFQKSVTEWFSDSLARSNRSSLFEALWNEDADKLTEILSDLLFNTISYHDYAESFYHAFVAGLFANAGYIVESNYENGLG